MDTLTEINLNYNYNKICNCDTKNYYCYCNGEDELLLKLQKLKRLKKKTSWHATKYNHLNIFKWYQTLKKKPCVYKLAHYIWPTICGNLDVLKLLFLENYYLFFDRKCILYEMCIIKYAMIHDQLHIIKWLIEINETECLGYFCVGNDKTGINCLKFLFEINETEEIRNEENLK